MGKPILQLTPKKYTGESAVISMRIPKDMLSDIDSIAAQTGRTRNEILSLSLDFALSHTQIITDQQEER